MAQVEAALAVRATPDGSSCTFFAAALAELLRHLQDFEGAVTHSRCRARGDAVCEWRTTLTPASLR